MDAITLLKADHDRVKKMLAEGEATTERGIKTRTDLMQTLKREMMVHERIEEEIFYPALKEHPKAKEIVLEGYEEHHVVDEIMGELEQTDVSDEKWGAKFKNARQVFGREELEELGARMIVLKEAAVQLA